MTDDETLTIQKTVIGGHRHIHDYTVIWRGKPIGRIMKSTGILKGRRYWWWGCNADGRLSTDGHSGSGDNLEDCQATIPGGMGDVTRRSDRCRGG